MAAGSRLLTLVVLLLGAAGLLVMLAWLFQRWLIYFPLTHDVPPVATVLPGSHEVSFETEDGLRLKGWFVPARRDRSRGAAVLVFNGNAGNRSFRAPLAERLSQVGLSVLLFDYRGYGGNPGRPSEAGLMADARAARAYLTSRDDLDPDRIVYFGESLGAALAVSLAVGHPPRALILRSPFTSLVDVARLHYPFLPVRSLLVDRYPCIERIGRVSSPLLVIAGQRDRIVPAAQSRELYEAAPEPKRLVLIPGVGHNDPELLDGTRLIEEVVRFLEEVAGLGDGPPGAD